MGMFDDFSSATFSAPPKTKPPANSMASQVAFSPADAAHADATNKAYPDDGFAQAYANASPADRADLLRSRTMKIARPSFVPDDFNAAAFSATPSSPSAAPAANAAPFDQNKLDDSANGAGAGLLQVGAHAVTSAGSSLYGLVRGLGAMAGGGSLNDAANEVTDAQNKYTYNPDPNSPGGRLLNLAGGMKYSPLKLLAQGTEGLGDKTLQATGSPLLATIADVGTNAAVSAGLGKVLGGRIPGSPGQTPIQRVAMPRVEPTMDGALPTPQPVEALTKPVAMPQSVPAGQSPAAPVSAGAQTARSEAPTAVVPAADPAIVTPQVGGLPQPVQDARSAVLQRIGLNSSRTSAITGDRAAGATDYQVSKFTNEPAGLTADAQFSAERQALVNQGTKAIESAGGTPGLDQDSMSSRGSAITAPLDAYSKWFDDQASKLYQVAKERQDGMPNVDTSPVDTLLGDRTFNNTAKAQDKQGLVSAIQDQLQAFKENNPGGMSVENMEQFRQWLNSVWSHDKAPIIGPIKDAVDNAVFQGAGEDVYGQARALIKQKNATLENPNGIAKILQAEPGNPMNRATALEKVPDVVSRLPSAQFNNLMDTFDSMPPELQGVAQQGKSAIQAQYANKMLEAGSNNKGMWNAKKVTDYHKTYNANIERAFQGNPTSASQLADMESAGHILSVDGSYPGAAAQAAKVVKRGVASQILQRGATGAGALVGSAFGPVGSAFGAAAGETIGGKAAGSLAERVALKKWNSGMTNLSDLAAKPDQ